MDLAVWNEDGETALHGEVSVGAVDVARMLVDHGADLAAEDSRGRTARSIIPQSILCRS